MVRLEAVCNRVRSPYRSDTVAMANTKRRNSTSEPVKRWTLRHWEKLALPFVLLLVFMLLPPNWFLQVNSVYYLSAGGLFTLNRDAASFANWFPSCRNANDDDTIAWCKDVDNKFPVVYSYSRTTAFLKRNDDVLECYYPAEGRRQWLRYQWEPKGKVSYRADGLLPCINGGVTTLETTRNLWLFGLIPVLRPSTSNIVLQRADTQSQIETLRREVEELKQHK